MKEDVVSTLVTSFNFNTNVTVAVCMNDATIRADDNTIHNNAIKYMKIKYNSKQGNTIQCN